MAPSRASGPARYAPFAAQKRAELRARRPKASKFDDLELASLLQQKLCVRWSPEQISNHLAHQPCLAVISNSRSDPADLPHGSPSLVQSQLQYPCLRHAVLDDIAVSRQVRCSTSMRNRMLVAGFWSTDNQLNPVSSMVSSVLGEAPGTWASHR